MDLYDKHLMARDSVWLLRLAMVAYVGVSAAVLHWWLAYRELPAIVSWVLAGMSGFALFLWSRGSRWRNRAAMRAAGQLDPALAKLPAAAKLLHPVRWAVTLYLTSWEPVATPEEARARYARWELERRETRAARERAKAEPVRIEIGVPAGRDRSAVQAARPMESAPDPDPIKADSSAPTDGETAAQRVRTDSRTAQDIESAVRALAAVDPPLSRRQIARIANTSPTTVRNILGPATASEDAQSGEQNSAPNGADLKGNAE